VAVGVADEDVVRHQYSCSGSELRRLPCEATDLANLPGEAGAPLAPQLSGVNLRHSRCNIHFEFLATGDTVGSLIQLSIFLSRWTAALRSEVAAFEKALKHALFNGRRTRPEARNSGRWRLTHCQADFR